MLVPALVRLPGQSLERLSDVQFYCASVNLSE